MQQASGMKTFAVFLPHSFTAEVPSFREATMKIGFVGRVLATFRVDELVLYPDEPGAPRLRNAQLIKELLDYLVTAPYLRSKIYPLKPSLRYAGLLPPLNIPTHPEADALKKEGTHYRQALVTASGQTSLLEAGLGKPLKISRKLPKNTIVTLRVKVKEGRIKYAVVGKKSGETYTGFRTRVVKSIEEALKPYSFRLATSRLGEPINKVYTLVAQQLRESSKTCIVLGAADKGLHEIAQAHGLDYSSLFTLTVNTAPNQGVKTIRTEEALAYTLAILNLAKTLTI